jgi:SNF2 family DNA or RNA helicase
MVLSGCGHPVCNDCLDKHHTIHRGNSTAAETCPTKGCGAINKTYQIIGAAELGVEDVSPNRNRHYGKKIEDIVHLLQHIPVDDQVLLFVQFPDLMGKIASALKDNGISVASLQSSADASKTLESFQDEKGRDKKKVLILNIGDASAAGR